MQITIARDYCKSPAGRYKKDGPFNAERFREEKLIPKLREAIEKKDPLLVDFAEVDSYSSSFLEEVFGGLVRSNLFSVDDILQFLVLKTSDPSYRIYVDDASEYIRDEIRRLKVSR